MISRVSGPPSGLYACYRLTVVDVLYCGICGPHDHHALSDSTKAEYSLVAGHEIVGLVNKVGLEVEHGLRKGDLIGIGPQCDSCRECTMCKNGMTFCCVTSPDLQGRRITVILR